MSHTTLHFPVASSHEREAMPLLLWVLITGFLVAALLLTFTSINGGTAPYVTYFTT